MKARKKHIPLWNIWMDGERRIVVSGSKEASQLMRGAKTNAILVHAMETESGIILRELVKLKNRAQAIGMFTRGVAAHAFRMCEPKEVEQSILYSIFKARDDEREAMETAAEQALKEARPISLKDKVEALELCRDLLAQDMSSESEKSLENEEFVGCCRTLVTIKELLSECKNMLEKEQENDDDNG